MMKAERRERVIKVAIELGMQFKVIDGRKTAFEVWGSETTGSGVYDRLIDGALAYLEAATT
ncbi:MAG: hypothetical protein ACOC3C_04135 [Candidatus Thorarchaeota archaeon]